MPQSPALIPPLLEVRHLTVCYGASPEAVRAVRDVCFEISPGETLALAGETGSGKSTIALSLLGLLGREVHTISGEILFEGCSLGPLPKDEWRRIRGGKIGMVFQDARSALNPVLTIGDHLLESIRAHQNLSRKGARKRALELLTEVGIPEPDYHMARYPFELSGGMCQRVGIALGICNNPRLLIADEPTSALDPTIQAQILDLLQAMKRRYGLALLLISHDLRLISEFSDRVSVMYHGRLVESGLKQDIFVSPAHPYTRALIQCQPDLGHSRETNPLAAIPGAPPPPGQDLPGCAFAPRCKISEPRCTESVPGACVLSKTHWAACIKAESSAG